MACNKLYSYETPDNSIRPGKLTSLAKPLSSESSLSSSGVSFEDTISDISNFTNTIKSSSEACRDLSSSGFVTNRDDANTISSSIQDLQVFVTPLSKESSKLNRSQLQQIRKSFLPYTGSSQFEDDDLEEEEQEIKDEGENVMTLSTTIHFPTAHFKQLPDSRGPIISSSPSDPICKPNEEEKISPSKDEELTLAVSNFLINLRNSSSLQISPPNEIIETITATPQYFEKSSPSDTFGCFRTIFRFFTKELSICQKPEESHWEWPPSEIHDLQYVGSGAQGSVYKAKLRGRVIAVKKVSKQSETEIRHLRGLCHPNVVQFLGVSIDGPWYSILMEYCPNGNFFDIIHNNISVSIESIIDWTQQIAQGMNYLHSHKVIHRDLKSPNILIGEDGHLKISDFGVSKEFTEHSTKMSFAGTVAWMAPEIMRDEPCSFKVDVWSFGVIVWEILTCEIPFNGVDVGAIIYGIASNRFSLPIPTSCPTEFRVLMKRCWCPKPRNRPSFPQILSQLELTCLELLQWREDDFSNLRALWQEEIHLQMMDLLKEGSRAPKLELSLMRQRRRELKDAQIIRQNYEEKLHRVNQLCIHLKDLTEELEREQRKASQERNRYKRLIYERSRSTTPFGVENFTKTSHPPVPLIGSSLRSQPRNPCRRRREAEAIHFTCKNCGTVNASSDSADRVTEEHQNLNAITAPSGQNSRWLKNWYAATKTKIIENASLMKTKLRRFASVGDIHEESECKKPAIVFKSVNVPTEEGPTEAPGVGTKILSQSRPFDLELEEQPANDDDDKSCELSQREGSTKTKNLKRFQHLSVSRDDLHCSKQPSMSLRRNSWNQITESMNPEQHIVSSANPQNSQSLKDLRPSAFVKRAEEIETGKSWILEGSQRSRSVLTSYSIESDEEEFAGSKATVILKHMNSRPQSGHTYHTRSPMIPLSSRGASSDRLQERWVSRQIEENVDMPPCQPSAAGPTLSVSHRSSPRIRQQPGRRLQRTPQSPLPAAHLPSPPLSNNDISSSCVTPRYPAPDFSLNSSSISTSPSLTTSQMRRSIEKLTMELRDHIADSLSEKERRVDVIERQLMMVACDKQHCLPVHSVPFVTLDEGDGNASTDSNARRVQYRVEKPWLSAADLNYKVNGLSMDASSILDNESIPTDSETDAI